MSLEPSPAVERAIEQARRVACRLRAGEVGAEHLLHGLLAEREGRAVQFLVRAGFDAAGWAGCSAAADGEPPPLPLGHAAADVLQQARDWASSRSAVDAVTSEQVLLVLLEQSAELRSRLEELGLDFERFRQAIELAHAPPLKLDEPLELGGWPGPEGLASAVSRGQRLQHLLDSRLYLLLTPSQCRAALDWTIFEAAAGGVGMVQLRAKELADRALLDLARKVRRWTAEAGVLFIMNDRPDLALLADADGVHVGQEELPVAEVRRLIGPERLIGVSTHSLEQVVQAQRAGADYLGVGPTFPSKTKEFASLAGLELVRQASSVASVPAFVIGGIDVETVAAAVAAGARRVAVSQAICCAADPRRTAAELLARLG